MKTIKREEITQYIGYEAQPTKWFSVRQYQIDQFAHCTLDEQFIHVDPEAAKRTPFGSTIAHGFLSLSMFSHFSQEFGLEIEGAYMGINCGFDSVRFISPVKVNTRIRAHAKTLEITEKKPGKYLCKAQVTIEIEGEEQPALTAVWNAMQLVA